MTYLMKMERWLALYIRTEPPSSNHNSTDRYLTPLNSQNKRQTWKAKGQRKRKRDGLLCFIVCGPYPASYMKTLPLGSGDEWRGFIHELLMPLKFTLQLFILALLFYRLLAMEEWL